MRKQFMKIGMKIPEKQPQQYNRRNGYKQIF